MQYEVILEITVALFAVFGAYTAIRTVAEAIFRSKNILVALEIKTNEDANDIEFLLREARDSFTVRGARGRVVVLLASRFEYNEELREIIDCEGAEVIIVE